MSSYQFTDKQISDFVKRNKDKKGWLNTRDVRSKNMPSLETRKLMQVVCDNLKLAFDNQIVFQNERYQICFELDQKDRMIENLDHFDRLVLTHPGMMDIPSRSLIINKTTPSDFSYWCDLLGSFARVFTAFRRYQNGQDIEDFQYFEHSNTIYNTDDKLYRKDEKEHLLLKVRQFIRMYKALRIGWKEIKDFYPDGTYNTFFIAILREHYNNIFIRSLSYSEPPRKKIIHSQKKVTLSNFHENIKYELERLSKDRYLDNSDRELSRLTLEKYNQEPHGQGFENAFAVLKKVAKKDP